MSAGQYGFFPFIAPVDFNPDAQEINIYNEFVYNANSTKRVVFSVPTSQATTVLTWTGVHTFMYAREIAGVMTYTNCGNPTTTVTWEAGSTKRHVFAFTNSENVSFPVPASAEWVYVGKGVSGITITGNTVKYVHRYSLDGIDAIADSAFTSKTLLQGSLTIPNSITSVGGYSFSGCTGIVGTLSFPSNITLLKSNAFSGCSGLTGNLIFSNQNITISASCFSGCKFTGTLVLPSGLTIINTYAFSGTQFSGTLVLPSGVLSVESKGFASCTKFTGLSLNSGLTAIKANAFEYCSLMAGDLIIPSSVTSIEAYAFLSCTGFTSALTINSASISILSNAFIGCSGLTALNLPAGYVGNGTGGKTFNFSSNFSAASLNQSILNLPDNFGTLTIGATNKNRLTAAYPSAVTNAAARGITIA